MTPIIKKWPLLRINLNFYQATHVSLIKNEIDQQSPEKNESGISKVLRKWLLSDATCCTERPSSPFDKILGNLNFQTC